MSNRQNHAVEKKQSVLSVKKAVTESELESAFKLRFEVFNVEMNEGLVSSYMTGLDIDEYDEYCDHIIVVDSSKDKVVGTYRLLPGSRAEKGIGFYSETEFELSSLKRLQGEKLELGRACVHRDYRGSAVLNLMWAGIARAVEQYEARYLFGCGSIHTINPVTVSNVYAYMRKGYLAEEAYRVTPIVGVPGFDPDAALDRASVIIHIPPLLLAYLRLGARVCGEPAFDGEFAVSDFLVLLDRERLLNRYRERYF